MFHISKPYRCSRIRPPNFDVRVKKDASSAIRYATRLHALQSADSQIGFEASNQYYYTPHDLVEKCLNARWIVEQLGG